MAGGQHGTEQALAAGTVPRLPDLVALMTTGVLWPHIASSLYRMEVRNYEEMYAAILTLAAIGIIAYMALDIAERKLCPWKK